MASFFIFVFTLLYVLFIMWCVLSFVVCVVYHVVCIVYLVLSRMHDRNIRKEECGVPTCYSTFHFVLMLTDVQYYFSKPFT